MQGFNATKFKKHLSHYIPLFAILGAGFLSFIIFSYDRALQAGVALVISLYYILWGILHHAIHKDLYFSVVLEYIAVSLLGLTIILSLILRT